MHDTARRIGTLAMKFYAGHGAARILEIGSRSVNGSLRTSAGPTAQFVGVDLEEGDGVDIVVQPGQPLPVEVEAFDLVIASSVFEHDPMFWITFLEMCRKTKEGGFIYINVPSNGIVHRYPQDNWRFYPDAAKALVSWAMSEGQHVSLVESFTAARENDIWNDFVAIFIKDGATKSMPETFIHEHVDSWNIMTWSSTEIINQRDEPEDMTLIAQGRLRTELLENSMKSADDALNEAAQLVEANEAELALRNIELLQRQEEVEQTRTELTQIQNDRNELAVQISHFKAVVSDLQKKSEESEAWVFQLAGERRSADLAARKARRQLNVEAARREKVEVEILELTQQHNLQCQELHSVHVRLEHTRQLHDRLIEKSRLASSEAASRLSTLQAQTDQRLKAVRGRLNELETLARDRQNQIDLRFSETATLTGLLRFQEAVAENAYENVEWVRTVSERLMDRPRWWAFMPDRWIRKREWDRLKRSGLFDASAYLERNPDVVAAGMDPVKHYLLHGLAEGRSRSI